MEEALPKPSIHIPKIVRDYLQRRYISRKSIQAQFCSAELENWFQTVHPSSSSSSNIKHSISSRIFHEIPSKFHNCMASAEREYTQRTEKLCKDKFAAMVAACPLLDFGLINFLAFDPQSRPTSADLSRLNIFFDSIPDSYNSSDSPCATSIAYYWTCVSDSVEPSSSVDDSSSLSQLLLLEQGMLHYQLATSNPRQPHSYSSHK